jgi:hypothetical protein
LWLESQVRPTVQALIASGKLRQTLRALGLNALPDVSSD